MLKNAERAGGRGGGGGRERDGERQMGGERSEQRQEKCVNIEVAGSAMNGLAGQRAQKIAQHVAIVTLH